MTVRKSAIVTHDDNWQAAVNERRGAALPGQSLHEHLSASVASLLDSGVWKPGDRIPGHRELSVAFGVSPVTMYKALSAIVKQGRLQRRQGLGTFVLGPRSFAASETVNLAVVFPLFDGATHSAPQRGTWGESLLRGIFRALKPYEPNTKIQLLTEFQPDGLLGLSRDEISGILFVGPTEDRWGDVERIADRGFPVVVLQAVWPGIRVPFIDADNAMGIGLAVDHLAGLGHTKIACGVASVNFSDHRARIKGFWDAMSAKGLPVRSDYVLERWMPAIETSEDDFRTLLTKPDRPTALITLDTPSALRAVNIARGLGLRIGDDLSIMTFEDDEVTRGVQPALTTVCQPVETMSETAILMLLDAVMGRPIETRAQYAPMSLIVRDSTGAPSPSHTATQLRPATLAKAKARFRGARSPRRPAAEAAR
ncbi:MAG: GntR family transcriptional regulator [Capsulimonadaceae bacterium]|nr:GntR family transcriptional regulator [Capsulimonadaceae bacterium]